MHTHFWYLDAQARKVYMSNHPFMNRLLKQKQKALHQLSASASASYRKEGNVLGREPYHIPHSPILTKEQYMEIWLVM